MHSKKTESILVRPRDLKVWMIGGKSIVIVGYSIVTGFAYAFQAPQAEAVSRRLRGEGHRACSYWDAAAHAC